MPGSCAILCPATLLSAVVAEADDVFDTVNFDESAVPPYEVPELLRFADGRLVRTADEWPERRREILGVFAREMYGREPPAPEALECELVEEGTLAGGLGIRRQYRMTFRENRSGP
jgi:hypothetical protein